MPRKSSLKKSPKKSYRKKSTKKSSIKKKKSYKKSDIKKSNKKLYKAADCKYKGTEPSPKGRGYCAHNQIPGNVAKGLDGNMWIVSSRKTGSLFWKKL